nr:MAG TPA: hypothetical protein [Caudoviricetes sp.]
MVALLFRLSFNGAIAGFLLIIIRKLSRDI